MAGFGSRLGGRTLEAVEALGVKIHSTEACKILYSPFLSKSRAHNRPSPLCHSWSIPLISKAQSNSTEPSGNLDTFSKKLDTTLSTAKWLYFPI